MDSVFSVLTSCGLPQYVADFEREEIDLPVLELLSDSDLAILIPQPEHRIVLAQALSRRKDPFSQFLDTVGLGRYLTALQEEEITDLETLRCLSRNDLVNIITIPKDLDRLFSVINPSSTGVVAPTPTLNPTAAPYQPASQPSRTEVVRAPPTPPTTLHPVAVPKNTSSTTVGAIPRSIPASSPSSAVYSPLAQQHRGNPPSLADIQMLVRDYPEEAVILIGMSLTYPPVKDIFYAMLSNHQNSI